MGGSFGNLDEGGWRHGWKGGKKKVRLDGNEVVGLVRGWGETRNELMGFDGIEVVEGHTWMEGWLAG